MAGLGVVWIEGVQTGALGLLEGVEGEGEEEEEGSLGGGCEEGDDGEGEGEEEDGGGDAEVCLVGGVVVKRG